VLFSCCSLVPSTLVVLPARVVRSTFRAEGRLQSTAVREPTMSIGPATQAGTTHVRANAPIRRAQWGSPASHILL
jgi:hypothetical protein